MSCMGRKESSDAESVAKMLCVSILQADTCKEMDTEQAQERDTYATADRLIIVAVEGMSDRTKRSQ